MSEGNKLGLRAVLRVAAGSLLSLFAAISASATEAAEPTVFDGYATFYASLPNPLFVSADVKRLTKGTAPSGRYRLFWTGLTNASASNHSIEFERADVLVDGRRLSARATRPFTQEPRLASAERATLYVNDDYVCIESQPSSASGTAARHVQASLIVRPFAKRGAMRFQLPSLFGSCLGLRRDASGRPLVLRANYRWPQGEDLPVGVDFADHALVGQQWLATGRVLSTRFVEPENVYRFTATSGVSTGQ